MLEHDETWDYVLIDGFDRNARAGVLDTDALAQMRAEVAGGAEQGAVAGAWLDAHPLGR